VRLCAGERLEVVAEAAQADGVEGEPCHVGGDVHGLRACRPVPLPRQLPGDLEHRRVVAAHRTERERRHEDVVRLAPVRLVVEGREQPVSADRPEEDEVRVDVLAEAGLVGEFGDEVQAGDEVDVVAEDPEPEERPQLLGLLHHMEQAVGATGDAERVADQREGRTLGDRLGSTQGRLGHGSAFRAAPAVACDQHTRDIVTRQCRAIVLLDTVGRPNRRAGQCIGREVAGVVHTLGCGLAVRPCGVRAPRRLVVTSVARGYPWDAAGSPRWRSS